MSRADSPLTGRLIFVVGARRSGTNWLQRLLTLHPSIAGVPSETYLFWDAIPGIEARLQHGLIGSPKSGLTYMNREAFLDASRDFCDVLFGDLLTATKPGATHLVERTPWHARRLPLIASVYPDASVLHIVRDPRDVAASLVAQEWGPSTYDEAAREWLDTVRDARAAAVPRYREIRQEDLAAEPEQLCAELVEWIGLDVDDELRAAWRREAGVPVNTTRRDAASAQARSGALTAAQVAAVETVTGELMQDLGYALSGPDHAAAAVAVAPGPQRPGVKRRLSNRARAALHGGRPASAGPVVGGPVWSERAQHTIDEFMTAVATDDHEVIKRLLGSTADVVIGGRSQPGAAGVEAFLAALPPHRHLRQQVGDVFPGVPTFTVVTSYVDPATTNRLDETLVITPAGESISHVAYYVVGS